MENKRKVLTSASQENLNGDILQKIPPGKDRSNFGKVPFSMEVITVLQDLQINIIIGKKKYNH